MKCPKCGGLLYVVAKVDPSDTETFRRRKCKKCGYHIRTVEFEAEPTKEFKHEWFEAVKKQRSKGVGK